jgi:ppGpp synthetase/RelA/SpoT-type nucleotidyltranferase
VFHAKSFSDFQEVKAFYKNFPNLDRTFFSSMVTSHKASLQDSIRRLSIVAGREGAQLSWRIKDMDSLKDKILKRIKDAEETGNEYTLNELHDVLGFRMTLPFSSDLLKLKSPEDWAQVLNLPVDSIVEVEEKGTDRHVKKGRYYTAIHLAIRKPEGGRFELQVMSEAMAIWSSWDHSHVMKPTEIIANQARLNLYSKDWAQIIHDLTPLSSRSERATFLLATAAKFGLRHIDTSAKTFVIDLNNAIKRELSLNEDQGFSPTQLEALAKTLH